MPCTLTKVAYKQLIKENIIAMDLLEDAAWRNHVHLEWSHIVAILRHELWSTELREDKNG